MQIDTNPLDNVVFSDFGCLERVRVGKGGERWMEHVFSSANTISPAFICKVICSRSEILHLTPRVRMCIYVCVRVCTLLSVFNNQRY